MTRSIGQLTPVSIEVETGNRLAPDLEEQHGGRDPDERLQKYVGEIGRSMLPFSKRADFPHTFTVLADPETVNAFAIGNGGVYVTRGLLSMLDDEAQLAEVVGHEIGHVANRHIAHKLDIVLGVQGLSLLIDAFDSGSIEHHRGRIDQAIGVGAGLLVNGFGRDQELESDAAGLVYMASAGYDPRAALDVFSKFQKLEGEVSGLQAFFRSHPTARVRIDKLASVIDNRFPKGGIRNAEKYRAMVEGRPLPSSRALPSSALEWGAVGLASLVDSVIMASTIGLVGEK